MSAHDTPLDRELVRFLEPDQLVAGTSRPLPRAPLTPALRVVLWGLRIFALVLTSMVVFTFVSELA